MKRVAMLAFFGVAKALAFAIVGGILVLLIGFVLLVNRKPDLRIWHTAELDEEFTEDSPVETFEEYLALEERLFVQLGERVVARIEEEDRRLLNRFHPGSLSDPGRWPRNWNRTFELSAESPAAGVLLLHGMSDSPYSLRTIGKRLHGAGAWVVGLRIPGHGSAPSGLVNVRWQDMAAAVRIAARHLREQVGDQPLFLVGFSNGGALAVQYALSALEDQSLPRVEGIVLLSPAIGVSAAARFAVWQERIGRVLGLDKLKWNSVSPEYDPFKYQSFAINAGDQAYRLTVEIRKRLAKLRGDTRLGGFPRVLAIQSAVDATVSVGALTSDLMERLPPNGHQYLLFDLNRSAEIERLLRNDPGPELDELLARNDLPFSLSLVTTTGEPGQSAIVRHKAEATAEVEVDTLGIPWPNDLFSLAHVAIPFSPDDPLYGRGEAVESPGIQIGSAAYRGETGLLQIRPSDMLRLRWNPFYPYIEKRILAFARLDR